jgi:hypothetical protein
LKLIVKPKNAPSFQTLMEDNFDVAFEFICWLPTIEKKFVEFHIVFFH